MVGKKKKKKKTIALFAETENTELGDCLPIFILARRQFRMEPENIESICLSVKGTANSLFYVCACYRSPNKCKVSDFISACATMTDKMLTSRSEIVLLGDMNIDMLHTWSR